MRIRRARSLPGVARLAGAGMLTLFALTAPLAQQDAPAERAGTGTVAGTVTCFPLDDCAGAVVYVDRIDGLVFPPGPDAVVDQQQLTFLPHVLPIVVGTTVTFLNSDEVWHNVFSPSDAKRFNLGSYPRGVSKQLTFDTPGIVELLCNVHSEMSAYVVVAATPYLASVSSDGRFLLSDVPAGARTLVAWHEQFPAVRLRADVQDAQTVEVAFNLRR